jgi:plasmid stability protein
MTWHHSSSGMFAPEVVYRLRLRAAQHGRSMAAEHREILRQALLTSEPGAFCRGELYRALKVPDLGQARSP